MWLVFAVCLATWFAGATTPSALAQAPAKPAAAAKDGPLATVNGVQIPRNRIEMVVRRIVGRDPNVSRKRIATSSIASVRAAP